MNSKDKLIHWNDDKSFGFIKSESSKVDVFIHISALKSNNKELFTRYLKTSIGDIECPNIIK